MDEISNEEHKSVYNNNEHIICELNDITTSVTHPLHCTVRIKYTCFDVSKKLLIFGATSGGLYIFNRDPCVFVQLIPNKEGTINHIKISPDEKCVAFATLKGGVYICDCGSTVGSYIKSPLLQTSKQHNGNQVTAMVWNFNGNKLYIGDNIGTISVLHLPKFIKKNVFQTTEFTLMHLDSKIVQLDIKEHLLLASTMTRSYICDTVNEQYRQIGQKLRDGEFGCCFFYSTSNEDFNLNNISDSFDEDNSHDRAFNALPMDGPVEHDDKLNYIRIFSARPGSRLWECNVDGAVLFTHQFKMLLAVPPTRIITQEDFQMEYLHPQDIINGSSSPKSINFHKLYLLSNKYIFTFKKDGIFIFDPKKPSVILWSNRYSNIVDAKVVNKFIYLWQSTGNIVILSFLNLEKFLLQCFVHQKFKLCAQICASHMTPILESIPNSKKMHLISNLGDKLCEISELELLDKISPILEELKRNKKNGQKLKSGIVMVDNAYLARSEISNDEDTLDDRNDTLSKASSDDNDSMLFQLSPDAVQAFKEITTSVTDKLNLGTKSLKKKWDRLEGKVRKMSSENLLQYDSRSGSENMLYEQSTNNGNCEDDNIIESNLMSKSQSTVVNKPKETMPKNEMIIKTIYRHIKMNVFDKFDSSDIILSILTDFSCDIILVYQLIKQLEDFMISSGETSEFSEQKCSKIFLHYISNSDDVNKMVDVVIDDETICSYFLKSFILINSKSEKITSCDCGYPLPTYSSQTPQYSTMIDIFIEKRWKSSQSEQCYEICKKVPYMWRKILYLRKNEDMLNLLLLILQMLDEELIYFYLPMFTEETWERAIKLTGTLRKNECLNCGKTFNKIITIEKNCILSWDYIGSLMIKSIGPKNALSILKSHSDVIQNGELSMKFYHTCIFIKLFEQFDTTSSSKLADTIYEAYNFEDAATELSSYLMTSLKNGLPHTALPLSVASKSIHWGLKIDSSASEAQSPVFDRPDLLQSILDHENRENNMIFKSSGYEVGMNLEQTVKYLSVICPNTECQHCCLPLDSRVLIEDGGLWVFSCGHTFHGVCLTILKIKLCPMCFKGSH